MTNSKKTIWVCKNCGSNKVQSKQWIWANTQKILWELGDIEDEDTWCDSCEGNRGIVTQNAYIELKRSI